MGPWRFEPFGIRLLSVSNPIKPLDVFARARARARVDEPRPAAGVPPRARSLAFTLRRIRHVALSLGPTPTLMGNPFMYRGPYSLLMYLPGFNSLRVPARFWMTMTLCLAVSGAMVFDRADSRSSDASRLAIAAVVSLGVLADTWMSAMPLADTPRPFAALSARKGGRPDRRASARSYISRRRGDVPTDVAPPATRQRLQRIFSTALRGTSVRTDAARSRMSDAAGGTRRHRRHRRSRAGSGRALG